MNKNMKEIGIKIQEKLIENGLGYFDESTGEIVINSNQPEAGKHVTMIHEFIHVIEAMLKQQGFIKRRFSHRDTDHVAMNLLLLLVLSGHYKGVTKKQMIEFWKLDSPHPKKEEDNE